MITLAALSTLLLVGSPTEPLATAGQPALEQGLDRPGRHTERVDASRHVLFELQWREPIVRTGIFRRVNETFGTPAVSPRRGLIIAGSGEGDVVAFKAKDGSVAWRYQLGEPFETSAALFQLATKGPTEIVVLGSRGGTLLALDSATGALVWKADVGGDVRAAPVKAGELLIVATAANRVHAVELATGKPVWNNGRPPPTKLSIVGTGRPLVEGNTVYAGFSDGYLEAYALADGSRIWSRPLSLRGGDFIDVDADPLFANGRLYVASYSDGVYALDPRDGQPIWTRSASAVRSLALAGDKLIAGSGDGWVFGFALDDGRLLHRTKIAGLCSRFEVRDNLVVFAGGESGLVVLDARDGKPLQASGYGTRFQSDPVWLEETVAVLSAPGYLYAFTRAVPKSRW